MPDSYELHEGWKLAEVDERAAREFRRLEGAFHAPAAVAAKVPGCVHLDLMRAGRLKDPFVGCNESESAWVGERWWAYRVEFDMPDGVEPERWDLVFDGLDTYAALWLNGEPIARSANMFVPVRCDVTGLVRAQGNVLMVVFEPHGVVEERRIARNGRLRAASDARRVYSRKAQYQYGWDWGPRLPTAGIWRPVRLEAVTGARWTQPLVRTTSLCEERAALEIAARCEALAEGEYTLTAVVRDANDGIVARVESRMRLGRGPNGSRFQIEIPAPRPWWPAGLGTPYLYEVELRLDRGGRLCDTWQRRIGLRTIKLVREPDEDGECFTFVVNGRRVFCKGANWIPADSFVPRLGRDDYRTLLEKAAAANMNMLRVWGGGIYERPEFYDLCDEMGLMVWQDFMFACGEYPDAEWFQAEVEREARWVVGALANHPCIVLWCGNNENHQMFDERWFGLAKSFRGRTLYEDVLPRVCAELDPTRPYWPGSPYGGATAQDERAGDRHNWTVWHGGADPSAYARDNGRFISEFGFQSFPARPTLERVMNGWPWNLANRFWQGRQKSSKGNSKLVKYLRKFSGVPRDLDDFIVMTQLLQAEALKGGIEHWRRRMMRTSGALVWQLNDCWPAISWSLVDYYHRPKAAYHAVRRAFAPLLVVLRQSGGFAEVWVIHDGAQKRTGTAEIAVFDLEGDYLLRESMDYEVGENESRCIWRRPLGKVIRDPSRQRLAARLLENGSVVGRNVLALLPPRRMKWLAEPGIGVEVSAADPGRRRARLVLRSRAFAGSVSLWSRSAALPLPASDQYFDLWPDEALDVDVALPGKITPGGLTDDLEIKHTGLVMSRLRRKAAV